MANTPISFPQWVGMRTLLFAVGFCILSSSSGLAESGLASFYCCEFAGRATASGELFDPEAMTAAHRTLPFGTKVRVSNTGNSLSIIVRINDRGPFVLGRIIDMSLGAARELRMTESGVVAVTMDVIQ
jgi:rare lipoprotein A